MIPLKPGDKVKFLNSSGGGIVVKVVDSRMVVVMIEDGFEIPTLISELIKIDPENSAGRFFEDHYNIVIPEIPVSEEEPDDERLTALPANFATERKSEDIYLAFVPHDQKWLISGPVDVFLVNNSSYDVLYNIFGKTAAGQYAGVDYGNIFPDSKLLISTINREELSRWTEGCIQFLFHKEHVRVLLPPFNSEFRIEGKKFYSEGNYKENSIIQARGVVARVLSLTEHFHTEEHEVGLHAAGPQHDPGSVPIIYRHQVALREAVVDLHIHELMDDPTNLDGSEILDYQKDYFLKCIDSALAARFQKVIFIHGIGNGTLRSSMIGLLNKQEGIEFFDAPMARYGAGALEIRIPHNG